MLCTWPWDISTEEWNTTCTPGSRPHGSFFSAQSVLGKSSNISENNCVGGEWVWSRFNVSIMCWASSPALSSGQSLRLTTLPLNTSDHILHCVADRVYSVRTLWLLYGRNTACPSNANGAEAARCCDPAKATVSSRQAERLHKHEIFSQRHSTTSLTTRKFPKRVPSTLWAAAFTFNTQWTNWWSTHQLNSKDFYQFICKPVKWTPVGGS